jgi:hypothetical protein
MTKEKKSYIELRVGVYYYFYPISELPKLPELINQIDNKCYRVGHEDYVKITLLASECLTDYLSLGKKYTHEQIRSKSNYIGKSFANIRLFDIEYAFSYQSPHLQSFF